MNARWYALGGGLAFASVATVILVARSRSEEPARCAAGMTALGARCCGGAQRLDADRCVGEPSSCAPGMVVTPSGCVARARVVHLAGGLLRVGPGDWEAQGVVTRREVLLAPFDLDALEATEQAWSACAASGACPALALSGEPGRAMVGMTADEAARFCASRDGALPSSDQLAFAAAGTGARRYAWGDTGAVCRRAAWGLVAGPCGRGAVGPELAGSHPDGASPEGVLDLAGNAGEWALDAEGRAEVRGGSFASSAASELRSWRGRALAPDTRSAEVGVRCAFAPERANLLRGGAIRRAPAP